jgi:hypothetical protein
MIKIINGLTEVIFFEIVFVVIVSLPVKEDIFAVYGTEKTDPLCSH